MSFNYYLVSFYMKYIDGSIYLNNVLSCVADFFGYLVSGVVNRWGIKRSFFLFFGISALFALGLIFTEHNEVIVPISVFGSKFGIASAFNVVYLGNP